MSTRMVSYSSMQMLIKECQLTQFITNPLEASSCLNIRRKRVPYLLVAKKP